MQCGFKVSIGDVCEVRKCSLKKKKKTQNEQSFVSGICDTETYHRTKAKGSGAVTICIYRIKTRYTLDIISSEDISHESA